MDISQNFITLGFDDLSIINGGVNWDSIASGAWVVGEVFNLIPVPQAKAVTLVCWTFAGTYFLVNGAAD